MWRAVKFCFLERGGRLGCFLSINWGVRTSLLQELGRRRSWKGKGVGEVDGVPQHVFFEVPITFFLELSKRPRGCLDEGEIRCFAGGLRGGAGALLYGVDVVWPHRINVLQHPLRCFIHRAQVQLATVDKIQPFLQKILNTEMKTMLKFV